MKAHFGHSNLGIFAEVINGGIIRVGDRLQPA
jgi:MOSC domain-containing protein YiiM